jgi:hypothetical protein
MWSNCSAAYGMYNVITTCVPEDTLNNMTKNFFSLKETKDISLKEVIDLRLDSTALSNHLQKILFFLRNYSMQDSNVVFKLKYKKFADVFAKF